MKTRNLLPKMGGGSLHLEFKKCGKSNCRCVSGLRHGPYFSILFRSNRRLKKVYVPLQQVSAVLNDLREWKERRSELKQLRLELKELRNGFRS